MIYGTVYCGVIARSRASQHQQHMPASDKTNSTSRSQQQAIKEGDLYYLLGTLKSAAVTWFCWQLAAMIFKA